MLGFINVNKKSGVSSANAVYKVKKLLKVKCGHMGTLDPLAEGVLPIGLGQATRLFDFLQGKKKTYIAEFDFSFTTPSFDSETEACATTDVFPDESDIMAVLPQLTGEVEQIPPAYSAKFVDGKRSYKLARKGVEVDLPPKKVTIYSIELLEKLSDGKYRFEIICSGGTYIRSIVRDMAALLDTCGTMTALKRTASGFFTMDNSVTVDELYAADDVSKYIIKPEDVVDFTPLKLNATQAKRLLDGLVDEYAVENGLYKVYDESGFIGVGEVTDGALKMRAYVRDL